MVQVVSEHELWHSLARLVLAAAALMGSPGPSTVSLTASGAAFGLRRSLPYCAGLIAGTLAVLLAVVAGVTALLLALPSAASVLAAASVTYILYLAYRIASAPPLSAHGVDAKAPSFSGGLLLGSSNPKAYVAIAAVYSGSAVPVGAIAAEALVKTTMLGLIVVLIHVIWLMAGASLSRLLRDPIGSRIANLLLAATLVITTLLAFTS
jgi:threonine/homoserine/homoserine lactone efflux protein